MMSDQQGRRGKSLYYCGNTDSLHDSIFVERGWAIREREDEAEMDPNAKNILPKKISRQINYRRRREASLARDSPTRLPCRPFYENGPLTDYDERNYDQTTPYHQKRIDDIPQSNTLDDCYPCVNHRYCDQQLCQARRLTCLYCEFEQGPLRVREKTRIKLEQENQRIQEQKKNQEKSPNQTFC